MMFRKYIPFLILIAAIFVTAAIAETTESEYYELIIDNSSSWCQVEIYGMGRTPTASMVKFFVSGKKQRKEKIYESSSGLPKSARLIKISRGDTGSARVSIVQDGVVIAGPWDNDSASTLEIGSEEFTDPWNTKYFYFYTGSSCDVTGGWINAAETVYMNIKKSGRKYIADLRWKPSGDLFTAAINISSEGNLTGKWKHTASDSEGALIGKTYEECSEIEFSTSSGNFSWTGFTWERDKTAGSMFPAEVADLSGAWLYTDNSAKVTVRKKKANDYSASVTNTESGAKFTIYFRLIGNSLLGTWFEENNGKNAERTGSLTGELLYDKKLMIEITDSSGPLDWEGITWER